MFQIQVHGDDWTSFYEQVPKELLPTEYGGNAGTVAEHWGESKHHNNPEILQFYCWFISKRLAKAPQNITNFEWWKMVGKITPLKQNSLDIPKLIITLNSQRLY